ncbi:putative PurR-regulated permease PerM [Hamadaea flava]|uniref:AI-2E family transporter n=1 Tax=Hamadaea flava TaxID=1742688 RepID=A0ABV8LJY4_9ACTN|nr:AI-2E family transporter [Hamadaea flava]MCP2325734.1 putative PurR-regulated permease PerM [Hamadaea flava]
MGRFEQARANIKRAYQAGRAGVRARRAQHNEQAEEDPVADPSPKTPEVVHSSTSSRDDVEVPVGLRVAAAWGWRVLILGIIVYFALKLVNTLSHVIIPLVIALLLSALLGSFVGVLSRFLPRSLATAIVVLLGIGAVAGVLTIVITQFVDNVPQVADNAAKGVEGIRGWLKSGPLGLTNEQLTAFGDQIQKWVTENRDKLTSSALATASTTADVLTGLFLVLFSLFFFLRDGNIIWRFFVGVLPPATREAIDYSGRAAWHTLVSYVRATVLVAFIDAIGIGVGLWILKVPLALPLAALVFLFAFIPIIGATVSGAVAVLVAGVTNGWVTALIVLAVVIGVQQLEGHVLQPLIMGKAVAIHPLAVIAAIAGGLAIAGIIGALIAVPLVAMFNTGIRAMIGRRKQIEAKLREESAQREAATTATA